MTIDDGSWLLPEIYRLAPPGKVLGGDGTVPFTGPGTQIISCDGTL